MEHVSYDAVGERLLEGWPAERPPESARERRGFERDLERVLGAALAELARACACASATGLYRGADGAVARVPACGAAPPELDAEAYAALAALRGAGDLGRARLPAPLAKALAAAGFSAAAPVAPSEGDAAAILMLGGPQDAPGGVREGTLAALADTARRLVGPAAAGASYARLRRLDAEIGRLDRLAALGELAAEVVHEIRNPLVSIKTLLQLLPEHAGDPELRTRFASVVEAEVRRLERLLDDVLDHARSAVPAPGGAPSATPAPVLESTARLLEHRARERGVTLEVDVPSALPSAAIPEDGLRQVVLNLALNAIDATPPQGSVRLRAQPRPGGVEILVEDQGRGVPRLLRERVFEPFFSTRADRPGGLGLAISRRVVEQAGGRLLLSDRPGGGATFRIQLRGARGRG